LIDDTDMITVASVIYVKRSELTQHNVSFL
jgi:hypothetical protein